MSRFGRRARAQTPSVILTLLGIVQALALELLWSWLRGHPYLYQFTLEAVVGWMQVVTTLVGVVLVWLIYVTNAVRFRWTPQSSDLVLPFGIGIIEFTLIECMGPGTVGAWFLVQALVFGVMAWVSQTLLRRARLDGGNDAYFGHVAPATWRDFIGTATMVAVLLSLGAAFMWLPGDGWAALLAIAGLLAALLYQAGLVDHYYRASQVRGD